MNSSNYRPNSRTHITPVLERASLIMLPSSQYEEQEPFLDHLVRKCKEQPLVPFGCALTVSALYLSGRAMRRGNPRLANRMFYWRVGAQGFTVAALVWGGWYYGEGYRKQEASRLEKLRAKAKEREQMWLDELDRIDEEAKRVKQRAEELKRKLAEEEKAKTATGPKGQ